MTVLCSCSHGAAPPCFSSTPDTASRLQLCALLPDCIRLTRFRSYPAAAIYLQLCQRPRVRRWARAWSWQELERQEVGKIVLARRNGKNSHHAVGCKFQNITRPGLIYLSHKKIAASVKGQTSRIVEAGSKQASYSVRSKFEY